MKRIPIRTVLNFINGLNKKNGCDNSKRLRKFFSFKKRPSHSEVASQTSGCEGLGVVAHLIALLLVRRNKNFCQETQCSQLLNQVKNKMEK